MKEIAKGRQGRGVPLFIALTHLSMSLEVQSVQPKINPIRYVLPKKEFNVPKFLD